MIDKPIRVLIADDSSIFVQSLNYLFSADPNIDVVGVAENGSQAVSMTAELRPDIITMDVHMPIMNGLDAIEQIMAHCPTPVLVLSDDHSERMAFEALERGALDISEKPRLMQNHQENKGFIDNLRFLAGVHVVRHIAGVSKRKVGLKRHHPVSADFHVIAVACSTGGPKALKLLLSELPAEFEACVLVVQHMSPGFSQGLADWLNELCALPVRIALDKEKVAPSQVLLAPDSHHMLVDRNHRIQLRDTPPLNGNKPSATLLFRSVGERFRRKSVGVVLTGMGSDGADGTKDIKANGGVTIAQDQKSSLVFGMPSAAIELGTVQHILNLEAIAVKMLSIVNSI